MSKYYNMTVVVAWRGCRMMSSATHIVRTDAYFCIVLQVAGINQLIHFK